MIQPKPPDLREVVAQLSKNAETIIMRRSSFELNVAPVLIPLVRDTGMVEQGYDHVNAFATHAQGGILMISTSAIFQ